MSGMRGAAVSIEMDEFWFWLLFGASLPPWSATCRWGSWAGPIAWQKRGADEPRVQHSGDQHGLGVITRANAVPLGQKEHTFLWDGVTMGCLRESSC